jgi:hypothetical protein
LAGGIDLSGVTQPWRAQVEPIVEELDFLHDRYPTALAWRGPHRSAASPAE